MQLSDIEDGLISDNLIYLAGLDPEKSQSYAIRDRSLLIGRSGLDKTAVVDVPEGHTFCASGNLFVLDLDKNKMDPYTIYSRTCAVRLVKRPFGVSLPAKHFPR